jgi:hypothetical protein
MSQLLKLSSQTRSKYLIAALQILRHLLIFLNTTFTTALNNLQSYRPTNVKLPLPPSKLPREAPAQQTPQWRLPYYRHILGRVHNGLTLLFSARFSNDLQIKELCRLLLIKVFVEDNDGKRSKSF